MTPLRDEAGHTIGYFHLRPKTEIANSANLAYLTTQRYGILIISAPVLILCIILSLFASRRLLRPINDLARGIHLLSKGDYSVRIPINTFDELGQLESDFNSLAQIMENNEKNRRQLVADIAHDLRTPLTIIRGETKALLDGIRPTSKEALASLNAEATSLSRMVEDLYQLSLYDISALHYTKEQVDLVERLQQSAEQVRPQFDAKGLTLSLSCPQRVAVILADHQRLCQLFANLFDNSLKYTEAGGDWRSALNSSPKRW
jgi:two-component system sensor histidine kinase BaeS